MRIELGSIDTDEVENACAPDKARYFRRLRGLAEKSSFKVRYPFNAIYKDALEKE
jgi:hypothetical protein